MASTIINLSREAKLLLLTILRQGFITEEQQQALETSFGVKRLRLCFADSREVVSELQRLENTLHLDELGDLECDRNRIEEIGCYKEIAGELEDR